MGYQGAIFDVDGVLVDSPHELAWREALKSCWRATGAISVTGPAGLPSGLPPRCTSNSWPASRGWQAPGPRLSTSECPTWIDGPNGTRTPSRSKSSSSSSKAGLGPFLMH
jgi:hypothetical protein